MLSADAPRRNRIAHEDAIAFFRANHQAADITYDSTPEGRTAYTHAVESFEARFPDGFPSEGTREECREYLVGFLVLQFNASNPNGPMDPYMRSLMEDVYGVLGIDYTPRFYLADTLFVPLGTSATVRRTLQASGNNNATNDGAMDDVDTNNLGGDGHGYDGDNHEENNDDDGDADYNGTEGATLRVSQTSSRSLRSSSRQAAVAGKGPNRRTADIHDQEDGSSLAGKGPSRRSAALSQPVADADVGSSLIGNNEQSTAPLRAPNSRYRYLAGVRDSTSATAPGSRAGPQSGDATGPPSKKRKIEEEIGNQSQGLSQLATVGSRHTTYEIPPGYARIGPNQYVREDEVEDDEAEVFTHPPGFVNTITGWRPAPRSDPSSRVIDNTPDVRPSTNTRVTRRRVIVANPPSTRGSLETNDQAAGPSANPLSTRDSVETHSQPASSPKSVNRAHPAVRGKTTRPRQAPRRRQVPAPAGNSRLSSQTCQECRKGHRHCDRRLPKCSLCRRLKKECEYEGSVADARKGTGKYRQREEEEEEEKD